MLPAEEKEPFKTFMSWIYRMQLHDAGNNCTHHSRVQVTLIIEAYIFADKRGIPGLKNAIIDLLMNTQMAEMRLPAFAAVRIGWEGTSENDGLRKLFVDWFVYLEIMPAQFRVASMDHYPKEMLVILLDRVIQRDTRPAVRTDAEWKRLKCLYHDHTGAGTGGNQALKNN